MFKRITNIYKICEADNLVLLLVEFQEDFESLLQDQITVLSCREFFNNLGANVEHILNSEPSGILQIACLTNTFYTSLCELNHPQNSPLQLLRFAFKDCLSSLLNKYIKASKHQVTELNVFLKNIAQVIKYNHCENVYLLELPIGNSIPIQLLKNYLLDLNIKSTTITISLNRNDSKLNGKTRKNLIEEKISYINNEQSTLIYLDEWITGANFKNILNSISKAFTNGRLIPCAIMYHDAQNNIKYQSYKKAFDKICTKMGVDYNLLICNMPKLDKYIDSSLKFFWSESDRLAGYRKLEIWGSIFSSIKQVALEFTEDPLKLKVFCNKVILEKVSKSLNLEDYHPILLNRIKDSFLFFQNNFSQNMDMYLEKNSIEIPMNESMDFLTTTFLTYSKKIEGFHEALLSLSISIEYIKQNQISPTDRYYFKGIPPSCLKLEHQYLFFHEEFMRCLSNLSR